MQLKHNVVLDLYFVYRARLHSLIWCIGSQFVLIIMVIILLTFERNKKGISNRGKWGCCRKSICGSADGKRVRELHRASSFGLLLKTNQMVCLHPKSVLSWGSLCALNSQWINNKDFQAPEELRASIFFTRIACLLEIGSDSLSAWPLPLELAAQAYWCQVHRRYPSSTPSILSWEHFSAETSEGTAWLWKADSVLASQTFFTAWPIFK